MDEDYSGIGRPRAWIVWLLVLALALPGAAAVWSLLG